MGFVTLLINTDKSSMFFSRKMNPQKQRNIASKLGNMKIEKNSKYLGSKNQVFDSVKKKVMARIQNWKGKLLSQAGKEVMMKSVMLAMPNNAMSVLNFLKICVTRSAQ
ncbi:hypothetical protein ACH5RR_005887 [Cinchona calisaya]|uniref:Uncharacterized protein n=1 Tax=Cinchona calisaya TaxID=153742 RepID=A0ABD3AME8_9GENT